MGNPKKATKKGSRGDGATDLDGKGRLLKLVVNAAPDDAPDPKPKSRVSTRYKAWILGTQPKGKTVSCPELTADLLSKTKEPQPFDATTTSKRDRAFWTRVGSGDVCPGWDVAIASMKHGETSLFVFAPEYGFGERAIPIVNIPANAWLVYEIKLEDPAKPIDIRWIEVFKTVAVAAFAIYYCFFYSGRVEQQLSEEESSAEEQ